MDHLLSKENMQWEAIAESLRSIAFVVPFCFREKEKIFENCKK